MRRRIIKRKILNIEIMSGGLIVVNGQIYEQLTDQKPNLAGAI